MSSESEDTKPAETRMTLGQAIELANALHRRGRTSEAIQIYQQILNVSPDNADGRR